MRILNYETFLVHVPVYDQESAWQMSTARHVLLRIDTDTGLSGWGEAWGFGNAPVSKAALDQLVAPQIVGMVLDEPTSINLHLQRRNHLWGRAGAVLHAISAIDIALWDIFAQAKRSPLYNVFGGPKRAAVRAYASLLRYGKLGALQTQIEQKLDLGYRLIKLHEVDLSLCETVVDKYHARASFMMDFNCHFTADDFEEAAERMREIDALWIEEPTFPPDDLEMVGIFASRVRAPVAIGENATTLQDLISYMQRVPHLILQPDVTKIGGISAILELVKIADQLGVTVVPHSNSWGPGLFATAQLLLTFERESLLEIYTANHEDIAMSRLDGPEVRVEARPGLGFEPDMDTIRGCL